VSEENLDQPVAPRLIHRIEPPRDWCIQIEYADDIAVMDQGYAFSTIITPPPTRRMAASLDSMSHIGITSQ
jgi:hypothetical protein